MGWLRKVFALSVVVLMLALRKVEDPPPLLIYCLIRLNMGKGQTHREVRTQSYGSLQERWPGCRR